MKLTIEPTRIIELVNGRPARLWRGRTESGLSVDVFTAAVGSADPAAWAELERDLIEISRDQPPEEIAQLVAGRADVHFIPHP